MRQAATEDTVDGTSWWVIVTWKYIQQLQIVCRVCRASESRRPFSRTRSPISKPQSRGSSCSASFLTNKKHVKHYKIYKTLHSTVYIKKNWKIEALKSEKEHLKKKRFVPCVSMCHLHAVTLILQNLVELLQPTAIHSGIVILLRQNEESWESFFMFLWDTQTTLLGYKML